MSLIRNTALGAAFAGSILSACATNTIEGPAEASNFRTIGPIDGSAGASRQLSWPASAVATQFTGSKLDVVITNTNNAQLDVEINGVTTPITLQKGRFAYPIIDDVQGSYDIRMVLRGERTATPILFAGFNPYDGEISAGTPADMQMLVIGDSISTGYGIEGESQDCTFSTETQNANRTFAAVAGRMLGADVSVIASSGRGLTRNWADDDRPTMRAVYNRLMLSEPPAISSDIEMDVVVVHLGTNDFWDGDPGVGFDNNYQDFLVRLRSDHPEALLVAGWGPMGGADIYDEAIGSIKL